MKKDVKLSMQKKIEIKKEVEALSNKSITIFTVALFCEVILMFLASALNGSGAYRSGIDDFISVSCGIAFGIFAIMLIAYFIMKKNNVAENVVVGFFNWSFVALAVSVSALIISAPTTIPAVLTFFGQELLGGAIAVKMVPVSGTFACYLIMALVAVYVVAMFVYYNMKANKIKKSK